MFRRNIRFLRDRSGAIAVEFAFFGMVLMILVLSIVDISRAISLKMDLNSAVRAGAEMAMRGEDESEIRETIEVVFLKTVGESLSSSNVRTFCMCPGQDTNVDDAAGVSCGLEEPCGAEEVTWVLHDLSATYAFESLFLRKLAGFNMSYEMRVQSP